MDDIPLKPKDDGEDAPPSEWTLKREEPPPPPPKPEPEVKKPDPIDDDDDDEDDDDRDIGLADEAGGLLEELQTLLGDRRCRKRLGPRILRFLYPLMMLVVAPLVCLLFEIAVHKSSGFVAALFALPVALLLLFVQVLVYRVAFEMAYAILKRRDS